jgi:hypothetical protein
MEKVATMARHDQLLQRIRQNHALEHATLHVLGQGAGRHRLMGRADWNGFTVYGRVDTRRLIDAAVEGLRRLQNDEAWLAIHPRCGTNLATGVLAATVLGQVAVSGLRSRFLRTVGAGLALAAGLFLAQPLGHAVQEHVTTSPDLADAVITAVQREVRGGMVRHRVIVGRRERDA